MATMKRKRQNGGSSKRRPAEHGVSSSANPILGRDPARAKTGARVRREWQGYYRSLLALRDHLLSERGEQLQVAATPLEPHSTHIADSASDELDHDLALATLSAEQDALYEVEEAIRRILEGSYGICEITGKPIPAPRLRVTPWTRFSREVQEKLESSNSIRKSIRLGALHPMNESVSASFEEAEAPEEERPDAAADDETLHVVNQLPRQGSVDRKRRAVPTQPKRGS